MAKKAAKNLVIVESPAKAKTIGKYLGPDYEVMASMGHLRDLPKSKIGVDVDKDFELDYKPIKGKEEIIRELKKAADKADMVYLATDPDREGEAISWHLKYLLDLDDASWAIASRRCCGRRSAGASPRAGCNRWPCAWWPSGKRK